MKSIVVKFCEMNTQCFECISSWVELYKMSHWCVLTIW